MKSVFVSNDVHFADIDTGVIAPLLINACFHLSSPVCGPAPFLSVRPLRWDENARAETADIAAGESESGRN